MGPSRAFYVIEIWQVSEDGVPEAIGIIPEMFLSCEACARAFDAGWPFESQPLTEDNCWVSDITPKGKCFCVMTILNESTPSTRITFADLESRDL